MLESDYELIIGVLVVGFLAVPPFIHLAAIRTEAFITEACMIAIVAVIAVVFHLHVCLPTSRPWHYFTIVFAI